MDPQFPLDVVDITPSTMDLAREYILNGHSEFGAGPVTCTCVMAWEQTAGRGQRGRAWYAARGESLCATYSLYCPPVTLPTAAPQIGLLAGVAVASALFLKETASGIGLKWPNDILLHGKKAGGILVEMMKAPNGKWIALVGVGINVSVREFPAELAPFATSMLLEGIPPEHLPELKTLARDIGASLSSWALQSTRSPETAIRMWRHFDATTGRRYETAWDGRTVIGTAAGIDEDGALLLDLDDGPRIAVTSASSLREMRP